MLRPDERNRIIINRTFEDDLWLCFNGDTRQLCSSINISFEEIVYDDLVEGFPVHVYFELKFEDQIKQAIKAYQRACTTMDERIGDFVVYF